MKKILIIFLILFLYGCLPKQITSTEPSVVTITLDSVFDEVVVTPQIENGETITLTEEMVEPISSASIPPPPMVIPPPMPSTIKTVGQINIPHQSQPQILNGTISKYEIGRFVYEIPTEMNKLETYTVKARVNRKINSLLTHKGLNVTLDTIIRTSDVMLVELYDPTSNSFNIVSKSKKQFVEITEFTEWVFSVTPLTYGEKSLSIVVSIIKDGNLKQTVYQDDVIIKTTVWLEIKMWLLEYWQWGFGVLILPLIKFLHDKYKNKRPNDNINKT